MNAHMHHILRHILVYYDSTYSTFVYYDSTYATTVHNTIYMYDYIYYDSTFRHLRKQSILVGFEPMTFMKDSRLSAPPLSYQGSSVG